jgi:antirestriction protein
MTPRLYVGTYAKYNAGSIKGAWLDLEDYSDRDAFLAACAELHKDEADPEFMFQDYEGFPESLYSEGHVKPELFEWLAMDESDRELLAVYRDHVDSSADIEDAREAYSGTYDSAEEWAEQFLEDTGALQSMPENLRSYFDYERYARDASFDGITFARHDGAVWVFWPR